MHSQILGFFSQFAHPVLNDNWSVTESEVRRLQRFSDNEQVNAASTPLSPPPQNMISAY